MAARREWDGGSCVRGGCGAGNCFLFLSKIDTLMSTASSVCSDAMAKEVASVMTYPTSHRSTRCSNNGAKRLLGDRSVLASELLRWRSKNEDFWPRACKTREGATLIKNLATLKHNKGYLLCFNVAKIRRSIAQGVEYPPMVATI